MNRFKIGDIVVPRVVVSWKAPTGASVDIGIRVDKIEDDDYFFSNNILYEIAMYVLMKEAIEKLLERRKKSIEDAQAVIAICEKDIIDLNKIASKIDYPVSIH